MDALKGFMRPEFVWAVVGMLLLLAEFGLPGLIVFFFALGAFLVALLSFFLIELL